MKFLLEIKIGNDAMQTCNHLADALRDVADGTFAGLDQAPVRDSGRIVDANGNTVGKWELDDTR